MSAGAPPHAGTHPAPCPEALLPFPPGRLAVVAITRHGIALAGRVVTALPGARFLNRPLRELQIRPGVLVALIVRGAECIVPFGDDRIRTGDAVILIARAGAVANLEDAFGAPGAKK